jgi:hypothetical protein
MQVPESPANPPQSPAKIVPIPGLNTRITPLNAADMARRRWAACPKRTSKLPLPQIPHPPLHQEQATAKSPAVDPFLAERRDVLRARMIRLENMLGTEDDPAKLDRLASALAKVAEQERILDGRPLPGSRRPAAERPAKPGASGQMSD